MTEMLKMGEIERRLMKELDDLEKYLDRHEKEHRFYDGEEAMNDYDKLFWDYYSNE